jgi:hypothetical protein
LHTESEAGVVDQHVDGGEIGRQIFNRRDNGGVVADIEFNGKHGSAEILLQLFEAFATPTAGDHTMASGDCLSGNRIAKARGRTGDKKNHGSFSNTRGLSHASHSAFSQA